MGVGPAARSVVLLFCFPVWGLAQETGRSKEKADLGKLLFFDPRLSRDKTISCSTCHDPRKGWTDQKPVSVGIGGLKGKRNAPSVLNLSNSFTAPLFWDGRALGMVAAAKLPLFDSHEMGMDDKRAVGHIEAIRGYRPHFKTAFGSEAVTMDRIAEALANFVLTLNVADSPFDRYKAGVPNSLTPGAEAGMKVFFGKGSCAACHSGSNFSDGHFHNIGVGVDKIPPDQGRFEVTKEDRDRGAYKTPTIRNLRLTFPYMHDGSLKTLEEVVDFYDRGGTDNEWLDPDVQPLELTATERKNLLDFLEALNGSTLAMAPPKNLPK